MFQIIVTLSFGMLATSSYLKLDVDNPVIGCYIEGIGHYTFQDIEEKFINKCRNTTCFQDKVPRTCTKTLPTLLDGKICFLSGDCCPKKRPCIRQPLHKNAFVKVIKSNVPAGKSGICITDKNVNMKDNDTLPVPDAQGCMAYRCHGDSGIITREKCEPDMVVQKTSSPGEVCSSVTDYNKPYPECCKSTGVCHKIK